jgi:hypothetical protein
MIELKPAALSSNTIIMKKPFDKLIKIILKHNRCSKNH